VNLTLRLAWRNLWRHSRRTWLTASAMIFSNVLLVFMIAVQFGAYDMMISNTLKAFSGHLQIQRQGYLDNPKMGDSIAGVIPLAEKLRTALPELNIAARGMAFALISSERRSYGLQVIGVEPRFEGGLSTIPGLVHKGRYLQDPDAAEIVIGSVMARNLKASLGDELTLLGSGHDGSFAAGVAIVVGIFDSGIADLDRSMAEVPLNYFQDVFSMNGHGHSIAVAANSLDLAASALEQVRTRLGEQDDLLVLNWEALQPGLKQAIQADLSSAWFMYAVLIVLVAFSVLNTQLMSVMERTREFGVIMSLGIRPAKLASLVMVETMLMAMVGFLIGLFLGWMVAEYFHTNGFSYPGMEVMGERFNLPPLMYPMVTPFSMVLGPGVVFLGCLLAAIYPALRLFRLQPVEAMRAV
jgi:ABC-type lipoprotein release transport system permease subunit